MLRTVAKVFVVAGLCVTGAPAQAHAPRPGTILTSFLNGATAFAATMADVAQNLHQVDGSVVVETTRNSADIVAAIDTLARHNLAAPASGVGSSVYSIGLSSDIEDIVAPLSDPNSSPLSLFSTVGANVRARSLPVSLLNILNPLSLTMGDLSTTSIGAMQSGSMTGTLNAGGIVDRVTSAATSSTTTANAAVDSYGGIANTVAFQNIAVNSGDINGSVQLSLNDVTTRIGKIGTTAIGAMDSGALTASITGNMGHTTEMTASIVDALVGN